MKKKYFLVILFLLLTMFFIINTSSVNATMYKILDSEGNVICLTNNPVLSIEEKEAGCTIFPLLGGSIEPMQDQITNEQKIKQQVSSGSEKYDFRETNWGMSKEQVKATENKKPDLEEDNVLAYKVKINGDDYFCAYSFLEDKLHNAGYAIAEKHTNRNFYIDDYKKLKEILIKKYGKPLTDRTTWDSDLYKDDRSEWGFAVSLGHLSYGATWETSTSHISLGLNGDNYKINLLLEYDSKELEVWSKQIKEKETSKEF